MRPFRFIAAILGFALLFLFAASSLYAQGGAYPTYPQWWTNQSLITTGSINDYAIANIGEAKNFTVAAIGELDTDLAQFGGAGPALDGTASLFTAHENNVVPGLNDYAVVNIGELKNLTQPIYDRLMQIGYFGQPIGSGTTTSGTYPWLATGHGTTNDYAAANIGQLKHLFSFDPDYSATGDSIPDWWKNLYSLGATTTSTNYVPWSNGQVTYGQAYANNYNPTNYYVNIQGESLAITQGSGQLGLSGSFVSLPVQVVVSDSNSNPLVSAPVIFSVPPDGSAIVAPGSIISGTSITLVTGADGSAEVFYQLPPSSSGTVGYLTATSGTATQSIPEYSDSNSSDYYPPPFGSDGQPLPAIPTQVYPAIDLSGSGTSYSVVAVTLDDSNNAAFAYVSSTDENGNPADYASLTWSNGQLSSTPNDLGLPQTVSTSYGSDDWSIPDPVGFAYPFPVFVSTDGTIYGSLWVQPDDSSGGYNFPSYFGYISGSSQVTEIDDGNTNGNFALPKPGQGDQVVNSTVVACNQNCYAAVITVGDANETTVVCNGQQIGSWDQNDDGTTPFTPQNVSSNGYAVGSGTDGVSNLCMDNSGNLTQTGTGDSLIAVNDAGSALGSNSNGAFLWQNTTGDVSLQSLIPPDYNQEIWSITPMMLSGTDTNGNTQVLFQANYDVEGSGSTGQGIFVLTVATGTNPNSVAQVSFPDGESTSDIQCINANGWVATIDSAAPTEANSTLIRAQDTNPQPSSSPSPSPSPRSDAHPWVQFRLLNGNKTGVDGEDFYRKRPQTISQTVNDTSSAWVAASIDNDNGIDQIGALPIGQGRPSTVDEFVYSFMFLASVHHPLANSTLQYSWKRTFIDQSITILNRNNSWHVYEAVGSVTAPENDLGANPSDFNNVPNNQGILTVYDNPGMLLRNFTILVPNGDGANLPGDYVYEKTDFTYTLTASYGSNYSNYSVTKHVGQVISMHRKADTGDFSKDWDQTSDLTSTTNIPDATRVTSDEIRNIVHGNEPIIFDSLVPQ
jgi:hypothetical protein